MDAEVTTPNSYSGAEEAALAEMMTLAGSSPAPGPTMPKESPKDNQPVQSTNKWEFDWKGKKIQADDKKMTQWAQQGYDYAQNMSAFKQERESFDSLRKTYDDVDAYAKANPDWWKHVETSYKSAQNPANQNQSIAPAADIDPTNPLSQVVSG